MIPVKLSQRSYMIRVADSYEGLPKALSKMGLSRQGWVISHASLLKRYGSGLLKPMRSAGWNLNTITVAESEISKSIGTAERVITQITRSTRMRIPVIFAFGGGVVGDLAGFVAAVYRRGIPYVQLPTTLLAQVDSAIGGKVGVDLPQGKNLVGAFHQPQLVWNNITPLRGLPMRQRRSGLGEVIKYGVIRDRVLFEYLECHMEDALSMKPSAVRTLVERSCRIKAQVVSKDERETKDIRVWLNFGHTLGHALEAATKYRRWTHGEAVAIGMCAAAALAVRMGLFPQRSADRLEALVELAGLPTHATGVPRSAVRKALLQDKKFIHGKGRWVLPTRIGKVSVSEAVPDSLLQETIRRYVS